MAMALAGRAFKATLGEVRPVLGDAKAEVGLVTRAFFAGDSKFDGRVVVEALDFSCEDKAVLDALEMESRILWNFRFVVLSAVGIAKTS